MPTARGTAACGALPGRSGTYGFKYWRRTIAPGEIEGAAVMLR